MKKSSVKAPAKLVVKDIRRQTWRHFSAEGNIRIVLDGLRGDDSIVELYRYHRYSTAILSDGTLPGSGPFVRLTELRLTP